MSTYSRRSRAARSIWPLKDRRSSSRSISSSRSRSRSRSRDSSVENPGNNLYVTGISSRVTKRDIEKHFSEEGKVEDVHLVADPLTRESRGFGFVTMSTLREADRCIKYLNGSVLDGRVITVEKFFGSKQSSCRHQSHSTNQLTNQTNLIIIKQISDS